VQSPDAHWKTIKTPHYFIHYPANPKGGFEAFAMEVASKIEGIHAKVAEWVGFEAKGPTNVLIQDPYLEANGATIPLLNMPIVLLYKTPPEPDSGIGHYDNWVDLLVTHELVHLHHLMRPQNDRSLSEKLFNLPLGPIMLKAPRLILEGYATMLEGRITGTGRPHSAYRAAVIRAWALQGKLPDYEAASETGGFRGGSMAYLLGSSYLEWLESQNPEEPDILRDFWKQLASKKRRSYSDSFNATFGTDPKGSYDRWRAEVTYDAVAWERNAKANGLIREGQLIARFDSEITDLAVSPDGTKLMARLTSGKKPGIRIWDLTADPEAKKKKDPMPEKPDPNEVEDRKPEFTEPKIFKTIGRYNGALPRRAWWTGDNQVTFEVRLPDAEGMLKPAFKAMDLKTKRLSSASAPLIAENTEFTWKDTGGVWNIVRKMPDGTEQQITRTLSAAWQPAPTPDGKALYYVRLTATGCEIRKIDLTQAAIEPAPSFDTESLLVQNAILSPPNEPSLLPPPDKTDISASNYSVWDSHHTSISTGYSLSPSTASYQLGLGGSDLLGRLDWFALGSFGLARGPRGAALGMAYRGWRAAPSLHAFSSLEKPSAQRYEPISGMDRERRGAELAFTWERLGMSPIYVKTFAAWEKVESVESAPTAPTGIVLPARPSFAAWESARSIGSSGQNATDVNRYLVGVASAFSVRRSRGDWGIGANIAFQGAIGRTELSAEADNEAGADNDWKATMLKAGLRIKTPVGPFNISLEEGRVHGDYTALDAFHLGGQNSGLVPASLDINRVQQPALPGYLQIGDRMRKWRADYGFIAYAYYEKSAVWLSGEDINYTGVAGLEVRLGEILGSDSLNFLGLAPSITIGIHRPLDGVMKNRTVVTLNVFGRL
ncbi:MAG: hypothetical protein LBQ86_08370, partial [Holophagales bacterium]|nr:hypothetical protein [Holophagales bacterium]